MHMYTVVVKEFLNAYVVQTRRKNGMSKTAMSAWMRMDRRSYAYFETGDNGLSSAALMCFMSELPDEELSEMMRQFRSSIT